MRHCSRFDYKNVIEFLLEKDDGTLLRGMITENTTGGYFGQDEIVKIGECFINPLVNELLLTSNAKHRKYIGNILKRLNWVPSTQTEFIKYSMAIDDFQSLVELGANGVDPLLSILNDSHSLDWQQKIEAAGKLASMNINESNNALLFLLNSSYAEIRWIAAKTLGSIGNPVAIMPLIEALKYHETCDEAAEILVKIGEAAISPLIDIMALNTKQRKTAIGKMLFKITGESFGKNEIKWQEWLNKKNKRD